MGRNQRLGRDWSLGCCRTDTTDAIHIFKFNSECIEKVINDHYTLNDSEISACLGWKDEENNKTLTEASFKYALHPCIYPDITQRSCMSEHWCLNRVQSLRDVWLSPCVRIQNERVGVLMTVLSCVGHVHKDVGEKVQRERQEDLGTPRKLSDKLTRQETVYDQIMKQQHKQNTEVSDSRLFTSRPVSCTLYNSLLLCYMSCVKG